MLPAVDQVQLRTLTELNAWNQGKFATCPESQTVERSLEQMYQGREYVRQVTAGLSDAELAKPAWFHLLHMRGFRSIEVALAFCAGHAWQHMEEARVRHGHAGKLVRPEFPYT